MSLFALGLISAAKPKVAPVPVSTTDSFLTSAGTTFNVSMPATVALHDRLIMVVNSGTSSHQPTGAPSGWNFLNSADSTTDEAIAIFEKPDAAGTEGGTSVAVTLAASGTAVARVFRISGGDPSQALAVSAEVHHGSTTSSVDPASLTPAWGSSPNLWIAIGSSRGTGRTISSYPTLFTGNNSIATNAATPAIASATDTTNAASNDPDAFTFASTDAMAGYTLAVKPA